MPMSIEYEVDGFMFGMVMGLGWEDGVVITSRTIITRSGFTEALTKAVKVYPDVRSASFLREPALQYAKYSPIELARELRNAPEYFLDEMLDSFEATKRQDALPIDDLLIHYVTAIRQEKARRVEHAALKAIEPKQKFTGGAGYVYLVQSPTGYYKIGRTVNPRNRIKTFGVQLPFEVEFVALIQTPNMHQLEQELHDRFAMKRGQGEWFALDQHDVDYIKGLEQ